MADDHKHDHDDSHDSGHDHEHSPEDDHGHSPENDHGHTHGTVDPALFKSLAATDLGIRAVKWSLVVLGLTAVFNW